MSTEDARENARSTSFDPARTALLVIDPVNDFLHEEGAAWEMTKSTVKKNDVLAQLARLTPGARAADVPVIFGPMAYTAEDYADQELQRRSGINRLMFENKMVSRGVFRRGLPRRHPAAAGRRHSRPAQGHRCDADRLEGAPGPARHEAPRPGRDDREPLR